MNNFLIILLDGVGVGELPDASKYNDEGSNTLGNISKVIDGFHLPNLQKLGIGNIIPIVGVPPTEKPLASFGKMNEKAPGKDSIIQLKGVWNFHKRSFGEEVAEEDIEGIVYRFVYGNQSVVGHAELTLKGGTGGSIRKFQATQIIG